MTLMNQAPLARLSAIGTMLILAALSTPSQAASFFFSAGAVDGKLGALSRRPSPGKIETETADDFLLQQTTVIKGATINGLIKAGTPLSNILNVEVEIYHVFPLDSAAFSGKVPSRNNSPSDFETDSATRDAGAGTLRFLPALVSHDFQVTKTVVNGINAAAPNTTGEPGLTGDRVEITITFTTPIVLPPGHYFFRPEAEVVNDDFLYLSAPRPIVSPGTPFAGDAQAWIRNSSISPDWLRIGTDIIGGAPTFSMTFTLTGETIPQAGTPGAADCHDQTVAAIAHQFGGVASAAPALGFSSVSALQRAVTTFCEP